MFPLQRKKSVTYFLSYPHLGIKVHWKNSSLLRKITKGLSELLQFLFKCPETRYSCRISCLCFRPALLFLVLFLSADSIQRTGNQLDHLPHRTEADRLILVHPCDPPLPAAVLTVLYPYDKRPYISMLFQQFFITHFLHLRFYSFPACLFFQELALIG